ncbi:MAG: GDSL-type esterase/lipase family protein, partial [Candidatus Sumerlaeota bacterium]|nr:GDSL-type esterase/lipase family protein [Candidatus Sumerlaeota bacterium]
LARIESDVLNLDPRIVIVLLGGNDYLRRYSIDSIVENMDRIILRIQHKGALVILVGMKSPLGQYEGKFRDLARSRGCPYVPNILKDILWNKDMKSDDIHPNSEGYALIAQRIGAVLRKYL